MRSTDSQFTTEKNKSSNSPIWLYTIYNFDGANNNLYFCEWDTDITFNSITYTKFPIKHDFISNNTGGQIDTVRVTVGNTSRVIQAYLEANDFRGKKVKIQIVFANKLATPGAVLSDIFYIDSYTADSQAVSFSMSSKFDILNIEIPGRIFMRNYCSWKFKGSECGYSGATSTCNRTPQACKAMSGGSNYTRFGGFPSVPTERIYVS